MHDLQHLPVEDRSSCRAELTQIPGPIDTSTDTPSPRYSNSNGSPSVNSPLRMVTETKPIERKASLDWLHPYSDRSSRNSEAGSTPEIIKWSLARVHATYSRDRSVL